MSNHPGTITTDNPSFMSFTVTYRCLPPGHNVEKIQMRTRHLATVSLMCDIKSVIVAHSCLFDLFIFAPRHRFTLVLLKTCKPVNWFCLVRYHSSYQACHGDVIKWKHFLRYWLLCGEFTDRWWIPPGQFFVFRRIYIYHSSCPHFSALWLLCSCLSCCFTYSQPRCGFGFYLLYSHYSFTSLINLECS